MEFNVVKCSVKSVGRTNSTLNYCLNDTALSRARSKRDLGVLVRGDLCPRVQCV